MKPNLEVGTELLADQLVEGAVVVLIKDKTAVSVSGWVHYVLPSGVLFYFGGGHIKNLMLARMPDQTLQDDTGARIRIYEYLGAL